MNFNTAHISTFSVPDVYINWLYHLYGCEITKGIKPMFTSVVESTIRNIEKWACNSEISIDL